MGAPGGTGWGLTLRVVDASGGTVRVVTLGWDAVPSSAEALDALAAEARTAHRDGHRIAVCAGPGDPAGLGALLVAAGFTEFVGTGAADPQAAVTTGGKSNAGKSEVSR